MTISTLTESLPLIDKGRISKISVLGTFSVFTLLVSISVAVSFGAINIPITTVWGIIGNKNCTRFI